MILRSGSGRSSVIFASGDWWMGSLMAGGGGRKEGGGGEAEEISEVDSDG